MKNILSVLIVVVIAIAACKKNTYPPVQTPVIDTTGKDSTTVIDSPVVHPPQIITYSLSYAGYTHETAGGINPPTSFDTFYQNPQPVIINFFVDVDTFVIFEKDTIKKLHPVCGLYKGVDNYTGTEYKLTDTSLDINSHSGHFGFGYNKNFHGTKK